MGLAASQARLLTITSRKSRAQFESMRLSHQKLALSRNLTDISNEYQNSLDQTKLYYDFYGVNSTDTPLTYNMLMSPSSINDYIPTLISNNQGQIILSTPYAVAAAAAGVPQEGLGCTPSSLMRDAFIMNLAEQGIITQNTAESICGVQYNQGAGLGADNLVNTITETGDFSQLLEVLSGVNGDQAFVSLNGDMFNNSAWGNPLVMIGDVNGKYKTVSGTTNTSNYGHDTSGKTLDEITFADLLNGTQHVMVSIEAGSDAIARSYFDEYNAIRDSVTNVYAQFGKVLTNILGSDPRVIDAVAYANSQMDSELWVNGTPPTGDNNNFWSTIGSWFGGNKYVEKETNWWTLSTPSNSGVEGKQKNVMNKSIENADEWMAMINCYRSKYVWIGNAQESCASMDLTNTTKAWFTYFMQALMGLGSPQSNSWYINWRDKVDNQSFADKDTIGDYQFTFTTKHVSDNEALISNFYDTLFNQICINGWKQNDQVAKDSNYLKEMLQSGQMYLTSMSDDHYFYQNNYATNSFLKEVSDDAAIAAAESKYTTEKARINAKEQELDLKMKNLDTEISSLETEYEAVKKVIENNVSKSFTRYDS